MKKLNELDINELRQIRSIVVKYKSIDDLVSAIDSNLESFDYQDIPLNIRFDLNLFRKLSIFTDSEIQILVINNIFNLQDLLDFNFENSINISISFKEKIIWVRSFYNMESVDKNSIQKQKI